MKRKLPQDSPPIQSTTHRQPPRKKRKVTPTQNQNAQLLVQSLITCKFNMPNLKNNNGGTPMHYAAGHGQIEFAQFLIQNHCSLDVKDCNGRTPLQLAAQYGKTNFVNNFVFF